MDTSGFYKLEDGSLIYAPNFVLTSDYSLNREEKESNMLPIDGWYWFDSDNEARLFFDIPLEESEDAEFMEN